MKTIVILLSLMAQHVFSRTTPHLIRSITDATHRATRTLSQVAPRKNLDLVFKGATTDWSAPQTVPVEVPVDVMLMLDTTASMASYIEEIKAKSGYIFSALSSLVGDIKIGVSSYRTSSDSEYMFDLLSPVEYQYTASAFSDLMKKITVSTTQTDAERSTFDALFLVGADKFNWRSNSMKIVFLIGNKAAADPSSSGISIDQVQSILLAAGIKLIVIDLGTLDSSNQATVLTNATGGFLTDIQSPDVQTSPQNNLILTMASEFSVPGVNAIIRPRVQCFSSNVVIEVTPNRNYTDFDPEADPSSTGVTAIKPSSYSVRARFASPCSSPTGIMCTLDLVDVTAPPHDLADGYVIDTSVITIWGCQS